MSNDWYVSIGDIAPYTNIEILYEIFAVALVGACLNGLVAGSYSQLWSSHDHNSRVAFLKKIKFIDLLVTHRRLSKELRNAIIAHYEFQWSNIRQSGDWKTNFLSR